MEQVDVERVALDPLAAVEEASQGANSRVDLDAERAPRRRGPRSSGRRRGRCRRCARRCRSPRRASGRPPAARNSAAPRRCPRCASTTSPSRTRSRASPRPRRASGCATRTRGLSVAGRWAVHRRSGRGRAAWAAAAAPIGDCAERRRPDGEAGEEPRRPPRASGRRPRTSVARPVVVGRLTRAEAGVAAAREGRAQRAAAGPGHRTQARRRRPRRGRRRCRAACTRAHTASSGSWGRRPTAARSAAPAAGRARSGSRIARASTATWSETGVDGGQRREYSGSRIDGARATPSSAQLRSAWMPPAVAQAPIVTSSVPRDGAARSPRPARAC